MPFTSFVLDWLDKSRLTRPRFNLLSVSECEVGGEYVPGVKAKDKPDDGPGSVIEPSQLGGPGHLTLRDDSATYTRVPITRKSKKRL